MFWCRLILISIRNGSSTLSCIVFVELKKKYYFDFLPIFKNERNKVIKNPYKEFFFRKNSRKRKQYWHTGYTVKFCNFFFSNFNIKFQKKFFPQP